MDKLNKIIIGANASIFQKIDPESNVEVFLPSTEEELNAAITFAREHKLPITTKGGGSGLSGACTGSSRKKVVIRTMRLKKVYELNYKEGFAIVEPGVTPDELNEIIHLQKPDWKFCVAPSSRDIATIGGILSTDGGGNDTWLAGTIVDNVLAVEMINYQNNVIHIERVEKKDNLKSKVSCSDKALEKKLQQMNFSLMDITGSHGVLGIITKVKVEIKQLPSKRKHEYALVHTTSYNSYGNVIYEFIQHNIPIIYGEAIVEAHHPDISSKTSPPVLILEFPEEETLKVTKIVKAIPNTTLTFITKSDFEIMKDIRVKMAKRNPQEGYQIALFEGYGIYGENLLRFDEILKEINATLKKYHFQPFIKFGHAPSIWHVGDETIQGIIMHSREKRPDNLTSEMVFNGIVALVQTCEKLGVTPKPEHKWPYSKNTQKYLRMLALREILGKEFNPFILDCSMEELANLVL